MDRAFTGEFLLEYEGVFPKEIQEKYVVLESLARNDNSETFLMEENGTGALYVLKCCKKMEGISFAYESRIVSGLRHEGLPRFLPEIESQDTIYIIREYIFGVTLEECADQLTTTEAVDITIQLCDILDYLHSQPEPIIHRDIKPSNIIIDDDFQKITLIDFGISRKYSEQHEADTFFFGTQYFAPPEQYGFQQTDCRTDIYAVGSMLQYLLTGSHNRSVIVQDKKLRKIVRRATAFSPNERYRNANLLKKALQKYKTHTMLRKSKIPTIAAVIASALVMFCAGLFVGKYLDIQTELAGGVVFTQPLVEQAVRLSLGKDNGEPILPDELLQITAIYIVGEKATKTHDEYLRLRSEFSHNEPYGNLMEISDFKRLENLIHVCIIGQPLMDLSPLKSNKKLERLEIMFCKVQSFPSLREHILLENIELYGNPLSDFSGFAKIPYLHELSVGGTRLTNVRELGDLKNLKRLFVHNTELESLEGIENFTQLKALMIGDTKIKDFSPLNDLVWLEKLTISDNMQDFLMTFDNKYNETLVEIM